MFLSKLTLDPQHPQARRDLGDAYEMHRTLARAYAPDANTPPLRFLWRLEPDFNAFSSTALLVQSDVPADWSVLDNMRGYTAEVLGNKLVDLEKLIEAGARYRFRLQANPTVTRDGKRYGLSKEEEQLAWITRQGERHGFSVMACMRGSSGRIQSRRGNTGQRIIIQTVTFDGTLEAFDSEHLRLAVRNGLGHGKAWGLGLFSLARIS